MDNSLLVLYSRHLQKFPLLPEDEQKALLNRYWETKDPKLATKLFNHNMRFVLKLASKFYVPTANSEDFIQEGLMGLMRGIEKYDPSKEATFAGYVQFWIKAYFFKYIFNSNQLVKIGTSMKSQKMFWSLSKDLDKMAAEDPEFIQVKEALRPAISLDFSPSDKDEQKSSTERHLTDSSPTPAEEFESQEFKAFLRANFETFCSKLKGMELEVFQRRMLHEDPETLESIGISHRLTRERIRQIEVNVYAKAKKFVLSHKEMRVQT